MPTSGSVGYAGYVSLGGGGPIRLHAPGRTLPIIVVPDFMGTRLADAQATVDDSCKGKLVWNPTGFPLSVITGGTPGPFAVDYERLQQISAELFPDESFKFDDKPSNDAVAHIKHFFNLVTGTYGDLLKALAKDGPSDYLASDPTYGKYGIRPKVYACGYDWRVDHAASALRLASVVEEALADTGERKVLIVAHGTGGLVARYYCKVLGGESKVFGVMLIASPNLGAAEAYTQLKHGLNAPYAKEYFNSDPTDPDHDAEVADNAVTEGSTVAMAAAGAAVAMAAGASPLSALGDAAVGIMGKCYLPLCIGAGRLLTRKEIVYFMRQMPSLYQMMPHQQFCKANHNWLIFDPLNTGHPPSGFIVEFPTLLDGAVAAIGGLMNAFSGNAQKVGDDFKNKANAFLKPDLATTDPGDPSQSYVKNDALLSANSTTLSNLASDISACFSASPKNMNRFVAIMQGLVARVMSSFLDCRNSRVLYSDIFTGLLDVPELRAISLGNLQLAYNFDDALTVSAAVEEQESVKKLVFGDILGPLFSMIGAKPPTADEAAAAAKKLLDDDRKKPRTYMHPRTIAYWSSTELVDGGSILFCKDVISEYDHNVITWQILPNPLVLLSGPPIGDSSDGVIGFGDGSVSFFSAKPPDSILTTPLDPMSTGFPGVSHGSLPGDAGVIAQLTQNIASLQQAWWKE